MEFYETDQATFSRAIRTRDVDDIFAHLKKGANVNQDSDGVHVFESVFLSGQSRSQEALDFVLADPRWNPNYCSVDTLHPEDRAMLHRQEEVALRIIQHPNFDRRSYPRVVRSAERFQADKVLQFFADQKRTR